MVRSYDDCPTDAWTPGLFGGQGRRSHCLMLCMYYRNIAFSEHLPNGVAQQLPDSRTKNGVAAHGGSSIAVLHDGERREAVAELSHGTTLSSLGYVLMRWADLHRLCITNGTRTCGSIV